MSLVRCRTKAIDKDFHRMKKSSNSEYKDSSTEYIDM